MMFFLRIEGIKSAKHKGRRGGSSSNFPLQSLESNGLKKPSPALLKRTPKIHLVLTCRILGVKSISFSAIIIVSDCRTNQTKQACE